MLEQHIERRDIEGYEILIKVVDCMNSCKHFIDKYYICKGLHLLMQRNGCL